MAFDKPRILFMAQKFWEQSDRILSWSKLPTTRTIYNENISILHIFKYIFLESKLFTNDILFAEAIKDKNYKASKSFLLQFFDC